MRYWGVSKLHPIRHDLAHILWCGPAALSVTTGYPTSVIHRHILAHNPGARRVKGVSNATLVNVAKDLGYVLQPVFDHFNAPAGKSHKPTLAGFLRTHRDEVRRGVIIVNVTRHYVVVSGRTFIDNQVRVPTPLKKAPGRRRRVFRAWRVVPVGLDNLQKSVTGNGSI